MNSIRVMDTGVRDMSVIKRFKSFFKAKTQNEIILLGSLKRPLPFKETVSLKTFDVPTQIQVSPSNREGFLKERSLRNRDITTLSIGCLRNDSTV
jgi:hypothetical protein